MIKRFIIAQEERRLNDEKYKDPAYSVKKIIQSIYLSKGFTDYKILSGSTPKELWNVVNEWIGAGYEPQGGPYFTGAFHFQAVVLRKGVCID